MDDGLPLLADFGFGECSSVVRWALDLDYLGHGLIPVWCGTDGYVVDEVAAAKGRCLPAGEVASGTAFPLLAGGDAGGLLLTLLDLLTGKLRYNLIGCSNTTSNNLLDGAKCGDCKLVPGSLLSELGLSERVVKCLEKGVRNGAPLGERGFCLVEMNEALEEAVQQQAWKMGISKQAFLKVQHQQLLGYFKGSK